MEPIFINSKGKKVAKNTVVIRPGKLDRSPCGTGTSARLALLRHKDEIKIGMDMDCQIVNHRLDVSKTKIYNLIK